MHSLSLFGAGVFMALFRMRENVVLIGVAGILFFANASLYYQLRTNIDNSLQGWAWGLIGPISQLGYVAAYVVSGLLADYVFTPLLLEGGALSGNVENTDIILGENSLADSVQDNGFCTQSSRFDFLLDLDNQPIVEPQNGELYVPVCYFKDRTAKVGEPAFYAANHLPWQALSGIPQIPPLHPPNGL